MLKTKINKIFKIFGMLIYQTARKKITNEQLYLDIQYDVVNEIITKILLIPNFKFKWKEKNNITTFIPTLTSCFIIYLFFICILSTYAEAHDNSH